MTCGKIMNFIIWVFKNSHGYDLLAFFCMLGILISFLTLPLMYFFIVGRFDPQFKDKTAFYFPYATSKWGRIGWYTGVMLVQGFGRKFQSKSVYKQVFDDYNLWKNASLFEKILVFVNLVPGIMAIIGSFIWYIHTHFF